MEFWRASQIYGYCVNDAVAHARYWVKAHIGGYYGYDQIYIGGHPYLKINTPGNGYYSGLP